MKKSLLHYLSRASLVLLLLGITYATQAQDASTEPMTKQEFVEQIQILPDALENLSAIDYDQLDATKRQSLVELAKQYRMSTTNMLMADQIQSKLDKWVADNLSPALQEEYAEAKKTATNH